MLMVPGLDRAENVYVGNIRTGESAIMNNLFDACARRSDLRRQIGQATWRIANDGSESAKAAVGDETTFNHATKHIGIDVAAANQKDHSLAGEFFQFSGHARGERRCRGSFDDTFFEFDETQDRQGDLSLGHSDGKIDQWLRDSERVRACGMASPSASVGCIAIFIGLPASSAAEKLATFSASTATIFTFGRRVLVAKEMPASRPAPPTGIITASRSGACSTISRPHRSLAGNDCGIIVAVDISEAFFLCDLARVRFCFAEIFSVKNDCRAEFLAIVYF